MKVYVLSIGEYSGWSIIGIFSSLEALGEAKAKLVGDGEDEYNGPDEYELDELLSHERGPSFVTCINCETGKLFYEDSRADCLRHPGHCQVDVWHYGYKEWMIRVISPVSAEHANKVATEKRQEWLRVHAIAPKAFTEEIDI